MTDRDACERIVEACRSMMPGDLRDFLEMLDMALDPGTDGVEIEHVLDEMADRMGGAP